MFLSTYPFVINALIVTALLLGCERGEVALQEDQNQNNAPQISQRGKRSSYSYAFSGQVVDGSTEHPVTAFSVEIGGNDPAIMSILNSLGDSTGLFHISRLPATEENSFTTVPLIISASGYQPVIHLVDLGSDCHQLDCPQVRPTRFSLQSEVKASPGEELTSPRRLQDVITQKGIPALFKHLMNLGKWNRDTEVQLAQARGSQIFSAVVFLKTAPTGVHEFNSVMKDSDETKRSKLPKKWNGMSHEVMEVASSNSSVATALLSTGELLPYLRLVANDLKAEEGGELAGLLGRFLADADLKGQLASLLTPVRASKESPELAMASFAPMVQNWLGKTDKRELSYPGLLPTALGQVATMKSISLASNVSQIGQPETDAILFLMKYLKPLAQAFAGKQGDVLMEEFNRLVTVEPLKALKGFKGMASHGKLAPYLGALVDGLNGPEAGSLCEALYPIVTRKNPGAVIRNIVVRVDLLENERAVKVVQALFPSASYWAKSVVPAKQLFASQILTGLFNSDFKEVRVTRDLSGAPAVVLSAQARDLVKLSILSNIDRVIIINTH